MQGNFYATAQDARMGRLSKYEWSRFVSPRFQDQRGLAATINNLPEVKVMSNQFKVGDIVRFKFEERGIAEEYNLKPGADYEVSGVRKAHATEGQLVTLKGTGCTFFNSRLDYAPAHIPPFTGQFSKAVSEDRKEVKPQGAARLNFLAARQKAWDAYQESRAQQGLQRHPEAAKARGMFNNLYAAAFNDGLMAPRPLTMGHLPNPTPLSRTGEAEPIISSRKAGKLQQLVLLDLQANGPGTAATIAQRIGAPLNAVSPRMAPLKRQHLIHVSGGEKVGKGVRSIYAIGQATL